MRISLSRHHRALLILIAISLAAGYFLASLKTHIFSQNRWTSVSFESAPVKFVMPKTPRHIIGDIDAQGLKDKVPHAVFLAEGRDGASYVVSMSEYPERISLVKRQELYEEELRLLLSAEAENNLVESGPSQIAGLDSLDFTIENSASGFAETGKIVEYEGTVYTLLVRYHPDYPYGEDIRRFFDSFEIRKEPSL